MTGEPPHLPAGARISEEGRLVYCTVPGHQDGEHGLSCTPPADPSSPELRLIRAIWGLCPWCDRTDDHHHRIRRGRMAHQPRLTTEKEARRQDRERGQMARVQLSRQIADMQRAREAQDAAASQDGSGD